MLSLVCLLILFNSCYHQDKNNATRHKIDSPLAGEVNHISTMLVVTDMDSSINFYKRFFGFKVTRYEKGTIALLECNNMELYFIPYSPATLDKPGVELKAVDRKSITPVCLVFNVKNCEKVYELLLQKGLKFLTPPQSPAWGGKRCFAFDPDGYLIEIEEGT